MEYCGGGDLFEKITSPGYSFSESKAAKIMRKLFLALNHCHSLGVAHRDLKPQNIMYSECGEIKLIDFGLSKQILHSTTKLKTLVGTPHYVAPEVLDGIYGIECDCWSLGVIMHTILSGELPFKGSNSAEIF